MRNLAVLVLPTYGLLHDAALYTTSGGQVRVSYLDATMPLDARPDGGWTWRAERLDDGWT